MTNAPPTAESHPEPSGFGTQARADVSRPALRLATGFGLGLIPRAPGTAGSLAAVALFAPLLLGLAHPFAQFLYLALMIILALTAMWSAEHALPHWGAADPQPVVIDEILGQMLTYGGLVLAAAFGHAPQSPRAAAWLLLIGFLLFRAFDVLKPFPIRQSERLPGAAGVLLDDVLAAVYAGGILALLAWSGWLR